MINITRTPQLHKHIVSGSALIADFIGVKETEGFYDSYGRKQRHYYTGNEFCRTVSYGCPNVSKTDSINNAKYYDSWDWLLPVYRKIRDIINDRAKLDKHTRTEGDLLELDAHMAICEVNIEKAFDSIVKFIELYNASLADR